MSAFLEILLELALNIGGFVLEMLFDSCFDVPDTKVTRIILVFIVVLLGGVLLWELR